MGLYIYIGCMYAYGMYMYTSFFTIVVYVVYMMRCT